MPRTIIQIYAAAVCFVSLSCFALSIGAAAYSLIGAVSPSFTMHPMAGMPPPEPPFTFAPSPIDPTAPTALPQAIPAPKRTAEEETKRRADALDQALRTEAGTSRQSLVRWSLAALISGFLFAAHWLLLRRESQRAA